MRSFYGVFAVNVVPAYQPDDQQEQWNTQQNSVMVQGWYRFRKDYSLLMCGVNQL